MEEQVFFPNKPAPVPQSINTEGITGVGELTTRTLREAITDQDYRQSHVTGAVEAYGEVAAWAQEKIRNAGPYDDTRALLDLIGILGDKIREVHSRATAGETSA